jgi:hypothetical protein
MTLHAEYVGWQRSVLLRREHSAKWKDRGSWKLRPSSCRSSPNVGEEVSLLKNPSTPLPSTLQRLKNHAIAVF